MIRYSDRHNFHGRNFPALFRVAQTDRIRAHYYDVGDASLKRAFGDYAGLTDQFASHMDEVSRVPLTQLFARERRGVRLWEICRYELLHHLMLHPRWYDNQLVNDSETIFDNIACHHPDELRVNIAAAAYWMDYWAEELASECGERPTVGLFGNSLSYTRALALQADQLHVTPLVFEHFFTGHDHYMEVRTSPIQGFNELRIDAAVEPDIRLVYQRLAEMRNKNVQQASFRRGPLAERNGRRRVLVVGQVVNDFAALNPGNPSIGTIACYKELLAALLERTDSTIVLKTHPYEARKTGNRGPITFDELRAFAARVGASPDRLRIVEDEPLDALLSESDLVVTLHSQAALEALAHGIPVATLREPFYGRHGFTHDFTEVDELVERIAGGDELFVLSEAERHRFHVFMTLCFRQLVNRHEPRDAMLARLAAVGVHPQAPGGPVRKDENPARDSLFTRSPFARKARKLVRNPRLFVADALDRRVRERNEQSEQTPKRLEKPAPGAMPSSSLSAAPAEATNGQRERDKSPGVVAKLERKARKLVRDPRLFFSDALDNMTRKR